MTEDLKRLLRTSFLFRFVNDVEFADIAANMRVEVSTFPRGSTIYSPVCYDKKVGFVVDGECEILHAHEIGSDVQIKGAGVGDTFGIVGIFADNDAYPTTVRAKRACTVCFIDEEEIKKLVSEYPSVSRGIITFFANRVNFLNSRIATFSSVSVEQKVAHHLLKLFRDRGSSVIAFNKARLAMELGVGRASLYRVLADLESKEILRIDNKNIQIIDPEGFERILK